MAHPIYRVSTIQGAVGFFQPQYVNLYFCATIHPAAKLFVTPGHLQKCWKLAGTILKHLNRLHGCERLITCEEPKHLMHQPRFLLIEPAKERISSRASHPFSTAECQGFIWLTKVVRDSLQGTSPSARFWFRDHQKTKHLPQGKPVPTKRLPMGTLYPKEHLATNRNMEKRRASFSCPCAAAMIGFRTSHCSI